MSILVYIPYHDVYDFYEHGIMTREYSLLKLITNHTNFDKVILINKPRTKLDKKKMKNNFFPVNSIEEEVSETLKKSTQIQHYTHFDFEQLFLKRGWWKKGYKQTIKHIENNSFKDEKIVVYSNNPFASDLILDFKSKGATIIFDMMDNFATHPSLNKTEKKIAYECYSKVSRISDFFSCNSEEVKKYCEKNFSVSPHLIKNGVFSPATIEIKDISVLEKLNKIKLFKKDYKSTFGYIGKIGKRIDEELVEQITKECNEHGFVFIGPFLKDQKNKKLTEVLNTKENVIHIDAISSSYIYNFLSVFDGLIIPHAVGGNENGGDPLKLYQYLNTKKPIITTPILGVEEFSEEIAILNDNLSWIEYINNQYLSTSQYDIPSSISWANRAKFMLYYINEFVKKDKL